MRVKLIIPAVKSWFSNRVFGEFGKPGTFLVFLKSGQTLTLTGISAYNLERGPTGFVSYTFERVPWKLAYEFTIDPQNISAVQQIK